MENLTNSDSYFTSICVERCGGLCCDPWWGIISYPVVKEGGLSNINSFRESLIKGLHERESRIVEAYVTREGRPRSLFDRPFKYNVFAREIKSEGTRLTINIMAMFAFRCRYLSPEKACLIHPSALGGEDIRPPHCGYMGSLGARPGEKGYCRIIHSAEGGEGGGIDESRILTALVTEKKASNRHLAKGVETIEEAADSVIGQVRDYCAVNLPSAAPLQKNNIPGRNDPCWCGSGAKFKKCHGR